MSARPTLVRRVVLALLLAFGLIFALNLAAIFWQVAGEGRVDARVPRPCWHWPKAPPMLARRARPRRLRPASSTSLARQRRAIRVRSARMS
jgi:hypothetical protein